MGEKKVGRKKSKSYESHRIFYVYNIAFRERSEEIFLNGLKHLNYS